MKKIVLIILAIFLLLCLLIPLTACEDLLSFFDKKSENDLPTTEETLPEIPSSDDIVLIGINDAEIVIDETKKSASAVVADDVESISLSDFRFNHSNVSYTLYRDEALTQPVTGAITLSKGDNTFYLTFNDDTYPSYTIIITRKAASSHVHAYGDWVVLCEATCQKEGLRQSICSCGDTLREDIPKRAHTVVTDPATAATCTESGMTEGSHCSVCNEVLIAQERIEAKGHHYQERITAPTCLAQGYTTHTCSDCQDAYRDTYVDALGHDLTHHNEKAPACAEIGWDAYDTCSRCDHSTYQEISALGHHYQKFVIAPTCLEQGYAVHRCSRCANSYINTYVAALGHHLSHHDAQAPTCVSVGWEDYDACSRCDYTTYQETPALGHDLTHYKAKAPTCTEIGWDAYDICARCDYTTYQERPLAEHTPVTDLAVAPTCTQPGLSEGSHCLLCEKTLVAQEDVPALGHTYGEWMITLSATCEKAGSEQRICDTCEAIDERIIPALGHALISYVGKAATCTEAGWNDYDTCARCDYTTYQAIDALEHQYLASVIAPTCLNQGYTIHSCSRCPSVYIDTYVTALGHDLSHHDAKAPTCTKVGYKEYDTCSRCDYTTYQKVAALGHDYQETVIAPTCLAQGYTEHTCSRCQNSYADTYVNALGHDITHHNAQAPTCIAVGWESYDTCSRCDYTTYQEIPPSGHTPVIDAGIAATCTQAGLTEGSHCSVCHAILVEQQIIAQGEHVAAAPTQEDLLSPTCLTAGAYNAVVYCSLCSVKLSSSEVILPALGHDYLATHHAADCIRYERNEWACSRCDAAYTETLSHTLMPHQYMAYTCSVCQRDEMSDYTERFESGEVVTLTSIREIAILIDYLIFYHNTAGIRFMMEGMTTENYNSYISQANKMCTNTNWALQFSATTKAGVLQSVRLFCAQNYDFDLVATITPESGDYSPTHYQQQDFLSIQNAAERASDYDDFPYQTRLYPLEVSTSDQLFFAFEHGYRPIPVPDSTAERMLNSAKAVNREILNDDMTDRDKVYRVMQWLVENVSYDYGAAGNTSINHFYASAYYLEGAFDYRLAVCDAYAKAICVMLGLEDIKCVRVTGNQHAWNRVYIDLNGDGSKEWYVVDATHADCGVSDANAEVLSLKQFLISDSQKTDLGYTANNYQDENALAITENNPFALCYYGNEGTSADYVITNKSEMKTLFSAVSAQLSAGTTDYFTVNIFVPKSYCSTSSSLISTLQKYVPRTFAYINHEVTYNGVSGWNSIILLYQ